MKNTIPSSNKTIDIDSSSIFRHLTPDELAQIPIDQEPEFYKRGTIIYSEGDRKSTRLNEAPLFIQKEAGLMVFIVYRKE